MKGNYKIKIETPQEQSLMLELLQKGFIQNYDLYQNNVVAFRLTSAGANWLTKLVKNIESVTGRINK